MLAEIFVDHSARKLELMASLLERCIASVDEADLWHRTAGANSIGNLVAHLCGNVNQWIGSSLGGKPDTRNRPAEFAVEYRPARDELVSLLCATVAAAVPVIAGLDEAALTATVETQDGPRTGLEVVYQVVGHFQQHTGQAIFAVKLLGRWE